MFKHSKKPTRFEAVVAAFSGDQHQAAAPAAEPTPPPSEAAVATAPSATAEPTVSTKTSKPKVSPEAKAAARAAAKAEKVAKRTAEIEARYPWVVPGSVRAVPVGETIGGIISKGRVATIRCVTCGAERVANAQDLFQVRYCRGCQAARQKPKAPAQAGAAAPASGDSTTADQEGGK